MGIESDQVVYEYLSRVGDVAHQQQLPSATRMRLVSELRNEIDRRRAKATADSPAAVRRIIDRIGSPDEVVAAAGGTGTGPEPAPTPTHVPAQRDGGTAGDTGDGGRRKGLRRVVPRPRPEPPAAPDAPPPASPREPGAGAAPPDWWRVEGRPFVESEVPGFTGGIEIPELLRPPRPREPEGEPDQAADTPGSAKAESAKAGSAKAGSAKAGSAKAGSAKPWYAKSRSAKADPTKAGPADEAATDAPATDAPAARRRLALPLSGRRNPLLLIAAGLLVVGALLGNWVALLLGWAIAYASRRLTQNESKLAVMGMPGLALAAGAGWLWGRANGRWGDPIAEGHLDEAIGQTWPWVVRAAAVLSALYLTWRSQRES
ncbi:hypothetical protein ABT301_20590 [Streptomyces sp. NPDC000987]|uniref:hypothetical protein n=1 Tax=Streptomyces sp. NPDC000987 TaxID=3154374 RepID=UPI00332DF649